MYTEQDLLSIRKQLKTRWTILGVVALLFIAAIVYSLIIRVEALTAGLTIAMGAILIFTFDLALKPLHCYAALLDNLLHGRTRELDCTYHSIDADISLVDGVKYYGMSVLQQDEDGGDPFERLLYWDAQKPIPQLNQGEKLHIVYHDRMIASLNRA